MGQQDIEYFSPLFNHGIFGQWRSIDVEDLETLTFPVILETEPNSIPYYDPLSLNSGMQHAFIVFDYQKKENMLTVYDRLAIHTPKNQSNQTFKVPLGQLQEAFSKRLSCLQLQQKPAASWKVQILEILRQSITNMRQTSGQESINYRAFGLEGIQYFSKVIRNFREAYHDDSLSIWLMHHHLPMNIFQSVVGNRRLLSRALQDCGYCTASRLLSSSVQQWSLVRKACVQVSNQELTYQDLSNLILDVYETECTTVEALEHAIKSKQ